VRVNGAPVLLAPDRTFAATVTGRYGLNIVELSGVSGGLTHTALCTFVGAERWMTEGQRLTGSSDVPAFRLEASTQAVRTR